MARRYRFDEHEIDLDDFRLSKGGEPVSLEPKALNLLIFLVDNRGRLVTRRELIASVWNDAFVTDHVLNRAIGQLRKVLQDDPKQPRYIETVPTLGYRFVGNVEAEAANGTVSEENNLAGLYAQPTSADHDLAGPGVAALPPSRRQVRSWRLAAGIALATAVCLGCAWATARWMRVASAARIRSLVVLPLENQSGDAAQQYLADGMTDELITDLGQIAALRVISRTTAMQYRNAKKPLPQIARELGVDAVLEGSFLQSGDRVRITAQLVSAPAEKLVWAKSYEGDLRDVLGLQNQVAAAVADQVSIKLTSSEKARVPNDQQVNPQAYEALLKGNFFFRQNTPEAAQKSLQYFQQALKLDPTFARAYVGIARSYNFLGEGEVPTGEATSEADSALAKALQLEPALAEAFAERGWTLLFYHWDFPGAERDFRHALELDPGSADAHEGYANYLAVTGHFDEANGQMRKARDLDPLSPITLTDYCNLLFMERHFAEAEAQCSAALELNPNYAWANGVISDIYGFEGKYDEAHTMIKKIFDCDQLCLDGVDDSFGRPGKAGRFEAWIHSRPEIESRFPFAMAQSYAGIGDSDKVFFLLDKTYTQRIAMHGLPFLAVDPHFDKVRSDPRFEAFLRRTGLPPQPPGLRPLASHSTKS